MKKTILATVIAATSFSAAADHVKGSYAEIAQDLMGSVSYQDRQEYKAEFANLETAQQKADFFKRVIVAETSTENFIQFAAKNEDALAKMVDAGLVKVNANGRVTIIEGEAYTKVDEARTAAWAKHVGGEGDNSEIGIDPIDPGFQIPRQPSDGDLMPVIDDEAVKARAANRHYDRQLNNGEMDSGKKDIVHNLLQSEKSLARSADRQSERGQVTPVNPIDVIITPVEPIAKNPEAIKDFAHAKVLAYTSSLDNEDKFDAVANQAEKKGYSVEKGASIDGTPVLSFTNKNTGEVTHVTEEQFTEHMANLQESRQNERQFEGDTPINGGKGRRAIDEINERIKEAKEAYAIDGSNGQGQVIAHSQAAQAQTQNQIDELYALGNQNASDIDTLFAEVDRLDTRIDQTQALNAATINARPMVTNGMTAFGAGVGYAGSEAALAIGVAHSFEDTGWSASGTVAASSDDSVLGAGVQYAF